MSDDQRIYVPVSDLERLRVLARRAQRQLKLTAPYLQNFHESVAAGVARKGEAATAGDRAMRDALGAVVSDGLSLLADLDKALTGKG